MKPPIFVRPLTDAERPVVEAGLRSTDAFVLRRCQILLASARGERPPWIAQQLGCASQTVRNAIRAFNARGLDALSRGSTTPKRVSRVFEGQHAADLKALLHQSPRQFGKDTSVWTLDLAAEVSFEQGLTPARVSDETVRQALKRLGVGWKRAKTWITSPDPAYARKKGRAIG
jgi:transposase